MNPSAADRKFAGAIPQYARSGNGELHATAFYYLLLGE